MNQKTKGIILITLAVLACIGLGILGWNWYDNNVDRSGWVDTEDGRSYKEFHGKYVTGWQDIDGSRYHFGDDSLMDTGWLEDEDRRYYLGSDGVMHTGWLTLEDGTYYLGADGAMHTGWLDDGGSRYYLSSGGALVTGWQDIDGSRYYLDSDGVMHTGWLEAEDCRYYLSQDGTLYTGWLEDGDYRYYLTAEGASTGWQDIDGSRYYLDEDGAMHTGWLDQEDGRYYLGEDGTMHTGWLEQGEYRYYLTEGGTMAIGPTQIGDRTYYFTPKGIHVLLVNSSHMVPDDYDPELVALSNGFLVEASCKDALEQMLADCRAAGNYPTFNSSYRSVDEQRYLLNLRASEYMAQGMSSAQAYAVTLQSVAVPGTSEHHLGLAVDLLGDASLVWLREHCWEYGFILRYLEGKSAITGIMYEPWHFRYVGTEVSLDMKDSGLCLEEYLGAAPIQEPEEDTPEE